MNKFDYIAPTTLREAINLLNKAGRDAVIMAGGTDLLVKIRHKAITPKLIVGLKKIHGIDSIHFDKKKGLTIGAMALLSTIAKHEKILKYYPTIAMAAKSTANPQIRNMGTVIGNICNASPSADNAPILLAMGATLNIVGPSEKKIIKLEKFFLGPGLTTLKTGEIVTSAFIPKPPNNSGTAYVSISQRTKVDCSAVGVGTMLIVNRGKFENVRLFIAACAPTPARAIKAEQALIGNRIDSELIHHASVKASNEMAPISDIRASSEYRRKLITVMSERAITNAKQMASKYK